MTIVDTIHTFEQDSETGDYRMEVKVCRSDADAICNIKVVLNIYKVTSRFWLLPDKKDLIRSKRYPASVKTVNDRVETAKEKGEEIMKRYEVEDERVNRAPYYAKEKL